MSVQCYIKSDQKREKNMFDLEQAQNLKKSVNSIKMHVYFISYFEIDCFQKASNNTKLKCTNVKEFLFIERFQIVLFKLFQNILLKSNFLIFFNRFQVYQVIFKTAKNDNFPLKNAHYRAANSSFTLDFRSKWSPGAVCSCLRHLHPFLLYRGL